MKNAVFMSSFAITGGNRQKIRPEKRISGRWKIKNESTHEGKELCTETANKLIWL